MNRLSRATALRIAAGITFIMGIYSFVTSVPLLMRGAADVDQQVNSPPYFVVLSGFVFVIVGIVGAYGTWNYQRWGIVLLLIVSALDCIFAMPGILFAPTRTLQIQSTVGVISDIVIIMLCLWRDPRPAEH